MSNLRNKLIRLAYAKPELRSDILPLVVNSKTAMDKGTIKQIERELNDEIGEALYDGNSIEFKKSFSNRGENYLLFTSPLLSYDKRHSYVREMESEGTGSMSSWSNNYGARIEINSLEEHIAEAVEDADTDLVEFSHIKIKPGRKGTPKPDEQGYIWATVEITLKVKAL